MGGVLMFHLLLPDPHPIRLVRVVRLEEPKERHNHRDGHSAYED